jgi:hypothetical protein
MKTERERKWKRARESTKKQPNKKEEKSVSNLN